MRNKAIEQIFYTSYFDIYYYSVDTVCFLALKLVAQRGTKEVIELHKEISVQLPLNQDRLGRSLLFASGKTETDLITQFFSKTL